LLNATCNSIFMNPQILIELFKLNHIKF